MVITDRDKELEVLACKAPTATILKLVSLRRYAGAFYYNWHYPLCRAGCDRAVAAAHYNPITQVESDRAVGPCGFVMTINFVLRWLLSLALFPTDLAGRSPTLHGEIHLLVALLAFVCGVIGELLLFLRFSNDGRWRLMRLPGVAIALLAIVDLFIVFSLVHTPRLLDDFGLNERIFIGLVLLWMLVVAVRLRSVRANI